MARMSIAERAQAVGMIRAGTPIRQDMSIDMDQATGTMATNGLEKDSNSELLLNKTTDATAELPNMNLKNDASQLNIKTDGELDKTNGSELALVNGEESLNDKDTVNVEPPKVEDSQKRGDTPNTEKTANVDETSNVDETPNGEVIPTVEETPMETSVTEEPVEKLVNGEIDHKSESEETDKEEESKNVSDLCPDGKQPSSKNSESKTPETEVANNDVSENVALEISEVENNGQPEMKEEVSDNNEANLQNKDAINSMENTKETECLDTGSTLSVNDNERKDEKDSSIQTKEAKCDNLDNDTNDVTIVTIETSEITETKKEEEIKSTCTNDTDKTEVEDDEVSVDCSKDSIVLLSESSDCEKDTIETDDLDLIEKTVGDKSVEQEEKTKSGESEITVDIKKPVLEPISNVTSEKPCLENSSELVSQTNSVKENCSVTSDEFGPPILSVESTRSSDEKLEKDNNNVCEPMEVTETESVVSEHDNKGDSKTSEVKSEKVNTETDISELKSDIKSEFKPQICTDIPQVETKTQTPEKEKEKDKTLGSSPSNQGAKKQKLDQLLSKITSKAESDSQKVSVTSKAATAPKQGKARKSCAPQALPNKQNVTVGKSSNSSSFSFTFNVKDLEKKGVLDLPKANKRKSFEPMKVKSNDIVDDIVVTEEFKSSPVPSPLNTEELIKEDKMIKGKIIKGKRKKKRSGYKLPGEKTFKKNKNRKKESEERQLAETDSKIAAKSGNNSMEEQFMKFKETVAKCDSKTVNMLHEQNVGLSYTNSSSPLSVYSQSSASSPKQQNALDMLTKNSKLSFTNPSSSFKKAKKSVRTTGEQTGAHRTLDSFLKAGGLSQFNSSNKMGPLSQKSASSQGSQDSNSNEAKKRKATDLTPHTSPTQMYGDTSLISPEEKKRRMDGALSPNPPSKFGAISPAAQATTPPQMITLIPSGSPPMGIPQPMYSVIPSSGTSPSSAPILISPGAPQHQQTFIQNGLHANGLPMFQILNNNPNIVTSQPQLVAIAQSPGKSLLTHSIPRTTSTLLPKGVPLLLTAVPMPRFVNSNNISIAGSQPPVYGSSFIPTNVNAVASLGTNVLSTSQQHPAMLQNVISPPQMHLSNGQYLDVKQVLKNGSVPNGLYPVTPPKTPEDHRSETGSQQSVEVSPGGTAPPDKDTIPLCTCKLNGASFQKVSTTVLYCQALDSVDGKVMGCCNKVTNSQLVRPAVKIPFLSVCETHRKRLRLHQCCPGCGHFCTQGKYMQCSKHGSTSLHHFHEQCQFVKDGKNYCPHCGETSHQYEVHLTMQDTKPAVMKDTKSSRIQTKAKMGLTERRSAGSIEDTEEPVVSYTIEKSKKVLSTNNIPIGPDKHSLERVLSSLSHERPKKYRHLPKCLYTPAYDNDLERTVYMLVDDHNANERYEDLEEQGALHAAAIVGSLSIVHVLIQAGASPHIQDRSLRTPLMCAAENNHSDVVSYLVKAGSIIDAKADDGMTALHYAAKAGHVGIIQLLLDTDRLTIDVKDDGGWTPLIWAAEHQEVEAVRYLLKCNAEPNLRDSEENTTLHWAAFSGSVAITEMLLTAGCDLDSLNMHGDRPLHIAARQDHYECVVLFLARGADVEAKNNKAETPLECCLDKTTQVHLALRVNKQLKALGAKHMGRPERLLHRDLSKGRENIPIPCVNAADDDGIPSDYLYVTDNIETTCLNINRVIGSLQSCQCKDDCSSIYCACGKNSLRCWYDKYGRLVPEFNMIEPPLIFECNRACACWTTCNNRVVQNGVMSRLLVFKTAGRGWGCKTLVDVQRGTFICEYIGEHISDSEADRREDDSYLFDLDNKDGETYCIDARRYGNIARFINHLCEPNLVPVKVFVDNQDLRFPRICLFASRDIKANEELGFDYGEKFWIIKWKQFTCTCGSQKCRYSNDTIQKTLEEYRVRHEDDGAEVIPATDTTDS